MFAGYSRVFVLICVCDKCGRSLACGRVRAAAKAGGFVRSRPFSVHKQRVDAATVPFHSLKQSDVPFAGTSVDGCFRFMIVCVLVLFYMMK